MWENYKNLQKRHVKCKRIEEMDEASIRASILEKYLWKNKYEEEMKQYKDANKLLFGDDDSGLKENDGMMLSKQQIIYGIIRELRNGNKMVNDTKF